MFGFVIEQGGRLGFEIVYSYCLGFLVIWGQRICLIVGVSYWFVFLFRQFVECVLWLLVICDYDFYWGIIEGYVSLYFCLGSYRMYFYSQCILLVGDLNQVELLIKNQVELLVRQGYQFIFIDRLLVGIFVWVLL